MSSAGDYVKILSALGEQGFDVKRTGNGHYRVKPKDPSKPIVTFAESNRDGRSFKNALADLRRSGFVWPPPEGSGTGAPHALEICPACGQGTWDPNLGECVNGDCRGSWNAGPLPGLSRAKADLAAAEKAEADKFERIDRDLADLDEVFAEVKRLREARELCRLDVEVCQLELERVTLALTAAHEEHKKASEAYDRAKKRLDELLGG